jgi:hypothetical protein
VLIAGHTHRPVFARSVPEPPPTRPIAELEQALEAASPADRPEIRAELEYARTAQRRPAAAFEVRPPCYFNTGCCYFPDGDVTGLDIADGEMRLVRWPANLREICRPGEGVESEKRVLVAEKLEKVLAAVAAPPERPVAVEREIAPA